MLSGEQAVLAYSVCPWQSPAVTVPVWIFLSHCASEEPGRKCRLSFSFSALRSVSGFSVGSFVVLPRFRDPSLSSSASPSLYFFSIYIVNLREVDLFLLTAPPFPASCRSYYVCIFVFLYFHCSKKMFGLAYVELLYFVWRANRLFGKHLYRFMFLAPVWGFATFLPTFFLCFSFFGIVTDSVVQAGLELTRQQRLVLILLTSCFLSLEVWPVCQHALSFFLSFWMVGLLRSGLIVQSMLALNSLC